MLSITNLPFRSVDPLREQVLANILKSVDKLFFVGNHLHPSLKFHQMLMELVKVGQFLPITKILSGSASMLSYNTFLNSLQNYIAALKIIYLQMKDYTEIKNDMFKTVNLLVNKYTHSREQNEQNTTPENHKPLDPTFETFSILNASVVDSVDKLQELLQTKLFIYTAIITDASNDTFGSTISFDNTFNPTKFIQ